MAPQQEEGGNNILPEPGKSEPGKSEPGKSEPGKSEPVNKLLYPWTMGSLLKPRVTRTRIPVESIWITALLSEKVFANIGWTNVKFPDKPVVLGLQSLLRSQQCGVSVFTSITAHITGFQQSFTRANFSSCL